MTELSYCLVYPEDCLQLTKTRIGKANDGGYVIPQDILSSIETVVTFGVNDEDSFEIDLSQRLGKNVSFFLCDPFCSYTARPGNETFQFHSLGLAAETNDEKKMISWKDFRARYLGGRRSGICLKVDIEFAEWESFEHLKSADFEGVDILIIEFHNLLSRYDTQKTQCKVLEVLQETFHLYHLHSNNNGYIFFNDALGYLPDVIECTYIHKKWSESHSLVWSKREEPYPESIDQPCHETKPDPMIHWWSSISSPQ